MVYMLHAWRCLHARVAMSTWPRVVLDCTRGTVCLCDGARLYAAGSSAHLVLYTCSRGNSWCTRGAVYPLVSGNYSVQTRRLRAARVCRVCFTQPFLL